MYTRKKCIDFHIELLFILGNRDLQTLLNLATLLHHSMEKNQMNITEVISDHGAIYLANANNRIVDAATLCFNDCNWLPDTQNMEFAHNLVPYQIAKRLGVNTKRQVCNSHSSL